MKEIILTIIITVAVALIVIKIDIVDKRISSLTERVRCIEQGSVLELFASYSIDENFCLIHQIK